MSLWIWILLIVGAIVAWYFYQSSRKIPLLKATISSPDGLRYKVSFEKEHSEVKSVEYIRMVLCFAAKMLHIIDPNDANQTDVQRELLEAIQKLSRIKLNHQTDVMEACGQPIDCTKGKANSEDKTIVATLYFMNLMERFVNTSLPYKWFRYQFLHSWLALVQETLPKLNEMEIYLLQRSLKRMSEFYFEEGADYSSLQALREVPNRAITEAK